MILKYIATLALLTLMTQAAWENGTWTPPTNCEISALLDNANATGSTSIVGTVFDNSTGKISNDSLSNWTFTVSLTEITTTSSSKEGLIDFWIDTSATVGTNETLLPYNACVILLSGAPQRGDSCLNEECLQALTNQYKSEAMMTVEQRRQGNPAYDGAQEVCSNMLTIQAPEECRDFATEGSADNFAWGAAISSSPDLNPRSALNCTPPKPAIPGGLAGTSYVSDGVTDFKGYDNAVSSWTPFIVTLWSNSTTKWAMGLQDESARDPFAEARVGCVKPSSIGAGSRDPATAFGVRVSPWGQAATWGVALLTVLMTSTGWSGEPVVA